MDDERFQTTRVDVLNPKCIRMGELYGEYSLLTSEWSDGLASTLIRQAVADTTQVRGRDHPQRIQRRRADS